MSAVPVLKARPVSLPTPDPSESSLDLTRILIAGTLVAGGALIVSGHRRAGLAVAATGTALALLEDQEVVVAWWKRLPEFLGQAQHFLEKVEHYAEAASEQGHRLQSILRR